MELNIDGDTITKLVSDAVLNSSIGDTIRERADAVLKKFSESYNNPIDDTIKQVITRLVMEVVSSEYSDRLREQVKEKLAAKITDDFLNKVVESAVRQY